MHQYIFLVLLFLAYTYEPAFEIHVENQWAAGESHSELLVTASFYNDNSKLVTGSSDNSVKIWSASNFSLLHE